MGTTEQISHDEIRSAVRELCARFPDEYWREVDREESYPQAFVDALTDAGWLAALIPTEYGGAGLGISEAAVIMEEINRSGANGGACHAQMYIMGTLLRHGSEEQKQRYLPRIASGELRLQAFGVTEPTTGSDTTQLRTRAERALAEGRHADAVVEGFRALTVRQVERGRLDDLPGATAHEVAAALAASHPEARGAVDRTAALFDAVRYGDRPATREQAAEVLALDDALGHVSGARS